MPQIDLFAEIDSSAKAVDWDRLLVLFLLRYVRSSAGTPAAEESVSPTAPEEEEQPCCLKLRPAVVRQPGSIEPSL